MGKAMEPDSIRLRVLSELADVTVRLVFISVDNPDDWKKANITVFKRKARKRIQETKCW